MKNHYKLAPVLVIAVATLVFNSCSKSNQVSPTPTQTTVDAVTPGHHVYGLLPTTPEEYASIPVYNRADFQSKHALDATNTPAPSVLTLATPDVRDQGQLGSCTGFCGTEAYEILWNYKYGAFPPVLSPAFLYYEERVNILKEKIGADNGANMVNIDQALTKYGITTEALYAYPTSDKSTAYKTPPSATAISTALGYKISSYTLINTGDTAAVKNCLRNHIPVMMGLNVYDNTRTYAYFEGLTTKSYTYNPLTAAGKLVSGLTLMGGHATPIVGYDDTKKAFLVQNSWGTSWGLNGYYYMPYSVFASTKIVPQGGVYFATL
jgi:hypothetical protein